MSDTSIRLYEASDMHQIIRLSQTWAHEQMTFGYDGAVWTADRLQNQRHEGRFFWVAEHASQVIGYVRGAITVGAAQPAIPVDEQYLEVSELYIAPAFRAQGIGRRLMAAIHQAADEVGVSRAVLGSSNTDAKGTMAFYETLGYRVWMITYYK